MCATQMRVGFSGAYGIDYTAIFHVANSVGIEMSEETLYYLQCIEGLIIAGQQKGADSE